jgi:hypothetical protein
MIQFILILLVSAVGTRAGADIRAEYAAALQDHANPTGTVEARWKSSFDEHRFLRFNPTSGAFLSITRHDINLRDDGGRCFHSSPPFTSFTEITDEAWKAGFDSAVDQLTLYFVLRSFKAESEQTLSIRRDESSSFLIAAEYVNDSRGVPHEIYRKFPANRLLRVDWTVGPSFDVVQRHHPDKNFQSVYKPAEKSPKGAWLLDSDQLRLLEARVVPHDPKKFTQDQARDDVKMLSRSNERKLVYSVKPVDDPLVATPISDAERATLQKGSGNPSWRWPLLGAGALVIVAAWIARRRTA